jgi:putative transposase
MSDERRLRILAVADDYTRECLAPVADTSISGIRVAREHDRIVAARSARRHRLGQWHRANLDRDPGLVGSAKGRADYIAPGKPVHNTRIESFKGRLRGRAAERNVFRSLPHARVALDTWRRDYKCERPHSSLGWQTPLAFAAAWQRRCAQRDRTFPRSEGVAPCRVASGTKNEFNHPETLVPYG